MSEIIAENEQKESEKTETQQTKTGDTDKENQQTKQRMKIVKIFDRALRDIDANLASSFVRFQLHGNSDATPQDIIDVMMDQTK